MKVEKTTDQSAKTTDEKARSHGWLIGTWALLVLGSALLYLLLPWQRFDLLTNTRVLLQKLSLAGLFAFLVLLVSKIIERIIVSHGHSRYAKYNFVRFTRLLTAIIMLLIFISFLFHNWYTAAVSLGLISLVLGFALQTPISSFIGWIYIIIRNPYRVGDRIQVTDFTGDVLEISYLDTTLSEFAGDYLTNDIPSGRLIRFPNSLVFQNAVYNYSWEKFPFIWNELSFHVAYESDLSFVEQTIKKISKDALGDGAADRVRELRSIVSGTPVEDLEFKEYPFVSWRTNANTWLEVTVSYLVPPKKAATMRSAILQNVMTALLQQPDKALFPKGNSR